MPRIATPERRSIVLASVTPLASIFGSGFLIIVPILTRATGPYAVVGMAGVCLLAWMVGNAVRHNVAVVEPRANAGSLHPIDHRLERSADLVIVLAYIISVALYLRILAQFVVEYAAPGSPLAERVLAVSVVGLITAVGLVRGLHGLELLERAALAAVVVLVAALVAAFADRNAVHLGDGALALPTSPVLDAGSVLLVLGGIVITVQGFETIRYLSHIDAPTRIAASRFAQIVSTVVYISIVALATPLMGGAVARGSGDEMLTFVRDVTPLLALPMVLCAVLSQFSAAVADTEASVGNMRVLGWRAGTGRRVYLVIGSVAALLAATLGTAVIIVVASRAFAAYYAIQCVVAARSAERAQARAGFWALAALMLAIALFARPAG